MEVSYPHAQIPTWRIGVNSSFGSYPLTCLVLAALPQAYSPASIAFRLTGARKYPLHDKAVVLERDSCKFCSDSSYAVRGEELLDQLADSQLLRKDISVRSCSSVRGSLIKNSEVHANGHFTILNPYIHQGILRLY